MPLESNYEGWKHLSLCSLRISNLGFYFTYEELKRKKLKEEVIWILCFYFTYEELKLLINQA